MKTTSLVVGSLVAASQLFGALAAMPNPSLTVPDLARRQKPLQLPSEVPTPDNFKSQGCYQSNANHTLNTKVTGSGVSSGSCQEECEKNTKWTVLSLQGSKCFCGTTMPPKLDKVPDSKCNYECPAYGLEACGSIGGDPSYFSIFNLGRDLDPPVYEEEEEDDDDDDDSKETGKGKGSGSGAPTGSNPSSSASEPSSPAQTESNDAAEETQDEDNDDDDGGPNVAGIVGGSVVGVVAIAAGAGGLWFFMRRRRNSEIEEEHRRNAAVNAFISGSKPPGSSGSISMTDSRLDPVMAHRRMSDGSIADNEDYSRKILRVTNA